MKFAKTSRALGLVTLAALASPLAQAENAGWYGGINVGEAKSKIDDVRITSSLLGGGFATAGIKDDDRDTGYKLFGGYQFNKNFAIEGGYFDLGEFGFVATTVPAGTLTGNIKLKGFNLDAVGILPITEKFSAFGRIGVNRAEAKDTFTGTGLVNVLAPRLSKRDTNYKAGFGFQYDFTEALGMRLEAERYRINDAVGNKGDIDLISIGLIYRFGAKSAPPVERQAAPAPYVAPPPQVVAAVAPPPPRPAPAPTPKRVTLSADSLFDFDKSAVKADGKQHLDKLAADLRGTDFEVVTVTGHTDRIGSHDYNMKLSMRRAEAVKTYLVESAGIPAAKISVEGKDGSDPVTKPGECKGKKATKALIACLQPDRRVDVEVSGTK
ncbi:MAG: OmpA family protein [Rhodocyclaceae bacterium]|nr:OmpA family protein [Rhodocyclaceae bacterium]